MSEPLPCPGCGRAPTLRAYVLAWSFTCPNCYGPVKDSPPVERLMGWSYTSVEAAREDWNDCVERYLDSQEDAA